MAENSNISWCDHTFNGWIGCTRISPACDGCYAAGLMGTDGRFGPARVQWGGPGRGEGTRDRTASSTWRLPHKWNRKAADAPGKTFVFCSSLADVFDNHPDVGPWRRDLFELIRATPNLTWLLLTKRPGMILKIWEQIRLTSENVDVDWDGPSRGWPKNAAIGCTIANQEEADRDIPKLLAAKEALKPAFAFLSMEPLLGPVDLRNLGGPQGWSCLDALPGDTATLDWIITGGETDQKLEDGSIHRARPADPDWYRSLRDQCAAAGVPFHFKQWGEWQPFMGQVPTSHNPRGVHHFSDALGAAPVFKLGKDVDPCTLDGVVYDARPEVRR